jgi:hypothetical protein
MLLTVLSTPVWSNGAQVIVTGWGFFLLVLGLLWWSSRQLIKNKPNVLGGTFGLIGAGLIAVGLWQLFVLTAVLTFSW